jgi:hypothetical protein
MHEARRVRPPRSRLAEQRFVATKRVGLDDAAEAGEMV